MTTRFTTTLVALASALLLGACGDGGPELSPDAEAGRSVFRASGCASCHGANGEGGVAPPLEGVWGQPVALDDGSTVIADRDYLRRSIEEPQAQIVDGYRLPMPTNDLDDVEIDRVLDFIESIGPTAEGSG